MLRMKRMGHDMTVCLEGEIDHFSAQGIRREIESVLMDRQISRLILDFSGVSFMDSSGVGMLIGRYRTMKDRLGSVSAVGLSPQMERLFRLAGLHRIITVEKGEENTGNE